MSTTTDKREARQMNSESLRLQLFGGYGTSVSTPTQLRKRPTFINTFAMAGGAGR
jgi:hypothetical protein